jgi:hypothetical protein
MEKKIMKVLTVTNDRSKCSILEQSLQTFGWDYDIIEGEWIGYSTKLHGIYAYLKANPQVKDFIFTDAFDTMFVARPEHFCKIASNFVSGETNCWTGKNDTETAKLFTSNKKFKYPNSGGFYMQSDFFIKLFEEDTPKETDDDQEWLIRQVFKHNILVDYNCLNFQTLYQLKPNEFRVKDGFIINNYTGSSPIVIHGNGRTDMSFYHSLFQNGVKELRKKTKITIGIPTRGSIDIRTTKCLMENIVGLINEYEIQLDFRIGTYVHQMRNDIVYTAIENQSDYLMFIDSDLEFPANGIRQLLSLNKDVVGGCYNIKKLPPKGTVKGLGKNGIICEHEMSKSLEKVYAIPTGFMLIKVKAIEFMPHPFDFDRYPDGMLIGEDINFCKRFNEMGREIWCDGSIPIGHIGEYTY